MSRYLCLIPMILLMITTACERVGDSDALSGQVDEVFAEWDKPDSPGVALAVVQDGRTLYQRGYGSANLEYGIPITPSSVFDIASVSKQFGAMAVALLVEQGKIALEDDIHKYLPEMPDFGKPVTVRHLVHHISGLRDWPYSFRLAGWRYEDVISFDDILTLARHQKDLNFDPGSEYLYSNTGYNLLAEIVARVTGQSFREWTDANIFRPLGMESTHFQDDHDRIVRNRASSYSPDGEGGFKNVVNSLTALGSSSLHTTAEDLAKWVNNFDEPKIGNVGVLEMTHRRGVLNNGEEIAYAFGQSIGSYRGLKTVGHGGSWAGFRTYLLRFPDQRFSVIVLGNSSSFSSNRTAQKVADIYLGDSMEQPEQGSPEGDQQVIQVDTEILDGYVGTYQLGPGWLLTITREEDKIMAQATREDKFPMIARSETRFHVEDYGSDVTFERDASGEVNRIEYRGIQADRVELFDPTQAQLPAFTGVYFSDELDVIYRVTAEEGGLFAHNRRAGSIDLTPTIKDQFSSGPIRCLQFTRDQQNRVTGLLVTHGRVRNVRFRRLNDF